MNVSMCNACKLFNKDLNYCAFSMYIGDVCPNFTPNWVGGAHPVKHGKWEETHISLCKWIPEDEKEEGHSFYMAELKCSCCERYNAVTFTLTLDKPDFCQLCGARMDLGGDSNV